MDPVLLWVAYLLKLERGTVRDALETRNDLQQGISKVRLHAITYTFHIIALISLSVDVDCKPVVEG